MRSVNYVDGHACPNGLKFSLSLKECRGPVSGILFIQLVTNLYANFISFFNIIFAFIWRSEAYRVKEKII